MAVNKVITVNKNKYVASKSGAFVKGKIVTMRGAKYYCAKTTGKVAVNRVIKLKSKRYVASKSGKLVCGKWVTVGNVKYYCNKSGVVTKTKAK